MFYKIGARKNFTKLLGKHPCWNLSLVKKETLALVFSCEYWKLLSTPFLQNTSGRLPLVFEQVTFMIDKKLLQWYFFSFKTWNFSCLKWAKIVFMFFEYTTFSQSTSKYVCKFSVLSHKNSLNLRHCSHVEKLWSMNHCNNMCQMCLFIVFSNVVPIKFFEPLQVTCI